MSSSVLLVAPNEVGQIHIAFRAFMVLDTVRSDITEKELGKPTAKIKRDHVKIVIDGHKVVIDYDD